MLLLLGGIGWLQVLDTIKMKRAISWVDRTHVMIEVLKELELDMREAESALRTYIITGNSFQRDEYRRQAFHEMQFHLGKMRQLTGDNPDQQRILDRMEPLLKERVALMEKSRQAYETAAADTARQKALQRSGDELTHKIVKVFAEFVERDQQLLAARLAARESHADMVTSATIASGVLGLGCVTIALFLILRGLKQRRQTERQLQVSLTEKETLLKEVHHRVKNNLQVISSLLSLESEKLKDDPLATTVFKECRDRIHSMARLHQQLYSDGHFASVDFGRHLNEMADMLVQSHMPNHCQVTLQVRNDPVSLDLDMAVTLGLIANESP